VKCYGAPIDDALLMSYFNLCSAILYYVQYGSATILMGGDYFEVVTLTAMLYDFSSKVRGVWVLFGFWASIVYSGDLSGCGWLSLSSLKENASHGPVPFCTLWPEVLMQSYPAPRQTLDLKTGLSQSMDTHQNFALLAFNCGVWVSTSSQVTFCCDQIICAEELMELDHA
jgi:hypothetical protein